MKKKTETVTRLGIGRKLPFEPTLFTLAVSLLITIIIELISRRSFTGLFRFITGNPVAFLINWTLIAFTISVAMMFRKKAFTVTLVSLLWLAAGAVNCELLITRTGLPLSVSDLGVSWDTILMMPVYYTWVQITVVALLVIAAITGLVFLFIKTPSYRRDFRSSLIRLLASALIFSVLMLIGLEGGMVSRTLRPSLYDAYQNYGFAYGFMYSFFDTGITKPEDYSNEAVQHVADDIDIQLEAVPTAEPAENRTFIDNFSEYLRTGEFTSTPDYYTAESVETIANLIGTDVKQADADTPNFVFVQLESFCDPTIFTNYTFSADPIPFFRQLSEEWPSGKISVPTVSGGTANTEFEILTACNLDFFGTGDIPFYSVLQSGVRESLATDLKTLGYTSTLLHSYTGSFYSRNVVYSNLCFDRFVSQEYMSGYETTPKGWVKDSIFKKYIMEALTSTEGRDFIYTVTVQTHGSYADITDDIQLSFDVQTELGEDAARSAAYYATMANETDTFIRELTELLSDYDEPVVLVLYGDHLPGLTFDVSDIADGNMYATPYVIWANFPLENTKQDLEAYQLSSYTLGMFGLEPGVMIRFHQTQYDAPDYLENMKVLEYDIMYGGHYIYQGADLVRTDDMQFGIEPIQLTGSYTSQGHLFVTGENFTLSSVIRVDGSSRKTIFVNDGLLIAPDTEPQEGESVTVAQAANDGVILSETGE